MSRKTQIERILKMVEDALNTPIPGTPNISGLKASNGFQGRVMYVALPGSKRKSRNVLSHRAQQVLAQVNRRGRTTAAALMDALEVNRNVIAGAVHELKQLGFLGSRPAMAVGQQHRDYQVAAEHRPRKRRKK